MTIFRHRSVEDIMPPDVRRRASGGIGKSKVDWYAGRRYTSDVRTTPQPSQQRTESDLKQMRQARRDANREALTTRGEQGKNVIQSVIARVGRILVYGLWRRDRSAAATRDA